jgi:hypothetical protein
MVEPRPNDESTELIRDAQRTGFRHGPPPTVSRLLRRIGNIPGAVISEGAFHPGPAVWISRREIAYLSHRDGWWDVRLTRQVIRSRRTELKSNPLIMLRTGTSDWLEVDVDDIEFAVSLVSDAVSANLATAQPGQPPVGPEFERRRRSH